MIHSSMVSPSHPLTLPLSRLPSSIQLHKPINFYIYLGRQQKLGGAGSWRASSRWLMGVKSRTSCCVFVRMRMLQVAPHHAGTSRLDTTGPDGTRSSQQLSHLLWMMMSFSSALIGQWAEPFTLFSHLERNLLRSRSAVTMAIHGCKK